jgi:hypothetical protein
MLLRGPERPYRAVAAKISVAEAEKYNGEGGEAEGCHPKAVDEHVYHDFDGEDSRFEGLWRTLHNIWGCFLESKSHIRHA